MSASQTPYRLFGALVSVSLLGGINPMAEAQFTNARTAAVALEKTAVPSAAFAIADEVLSYRATGERGKTDEIEVSLESIIDRTGGFDQGAGL